jgi:hypothetical protein
VRRRSISVTPTLQKVVNLFDEKNGGATHQGFPSRPTRDGNVSRKIHRNRNGGPNGIRAVVGHLTFHVAGRVARQTVRDPRFRTAARCRRLGACLATPESGPSSNASGSRPPRRERLLATGSSPPDDALEPSTARTCPITAVEVASGPEPRRSVAGLVTVDADGCGDAVVAEVNHPVRAEVGRNLLFARHRSAHRQSYRSSNVAMMAWTVVELSKDATTAPLLLPCFTVIRWVAWSYANAS